MNLIDFIKFGDIDPKSRATAVVVPLEPVNRLKVEDGKGVSIADNNETVVDDENVKAIADCCIEWRAGTVKPVYMHFSEPTIIPRGVYATKMDLWQNVYSRNSFVKTKGKKQNKYFLRTRRFICSSKVVF